jgi:hypothetical protein
MAKNRAYADFFTLYLRPFAQKSKNFVVVSRVIDIVDVKSAIS